ncbi:coiled-coil domain-containing protein [Konateibacter massiliensis]|uniref:hypothetical protein n=1 Tax=Konateibacter massiliensis TaxID=2002841 RepID=UPI000C146E65|nr:hypothetical protein [Konateibacter massiliensis]
MKDRERNLEKFEEALKGKKVPLVTLDNKWYELFDKELRTFTMTSLEKKLNKLIRRQGQLYNELKEMESAKKTLMDKILENMDPNEDESISDLKNKKLDASQKLIKDLNNKITSGEQELEQLPIEIDMVNRTLLIEGMRVCYNAMKEDKKHIEAIDAWIEDVREKLKENVGMKQDIKDEINRIYSYMHDILGFEVLNVFDLYHEEAPTEE